MKPYVLTIGDDDSTIELLRRNLEREGFDAAEARTSSQAFMRLAERRPDAILLDWAVKTVSGIELCQEIRRRPNCQTIHVIMMVPQGQDRSRGFDAGADSCINKPFSMADLIARLRFAIRRADPTIMQEIFKFADVELDLGACRVTRGGCSVHLGPTEFRLLRFFLQHPRRVFSRENLRDAIWGCDVDIDTRTVDVHIRRLRKAMNIKRVPDIIRTVRSAGYAMDVESESRKAG